MQFKRKQPAGEPPPELEKRVDEIMSASTDPTGPEPKHPIAVNFRDTQGFKVGVEHPKLLEPAPTKITPRTDEAPLPRPRRSVLDDAVTDKAVDDIMVNESNEVLAAEDATREAINRPKRKKRRFDFKRLLKNKWSYVALGLIIIALFAVPFTRYPILGLFIKNPIQLEIVDNSTDSAVSGAKVIIGKQTKTTDASGEVSFSLPVGKHRYKIAKTYYNTSSGSLFIGLAKPQPTSIKLAATGRQVVISVINEISSQPVANATIAVDNTDAITSSKGQTQIVLPTNQATYKAQVTADGYNDLTASVQVTTNAKANVIKIVPAGYIYFLNDSASTINVMKANLDGSDPIILLAGNGTEQPDKTFLMASPDWKYLALEAIRSGTQPELYVIDTADGSATEFDSAQDIFTLIGWSSDNFVYDEVAPGTSTYSSGHEQIKSYNAVTQQLNVLDQDQIAGTSTTYGYQSFSNFELLPNLLVYTTTWNAVDGYSLSSSSDTVRGVMPSGLNKKDYYPFSASTTTSLGLVRYQPQALYIEDNDSSSGTGYYNYVNGAVTSTSIDQSTYSKTYPTYYFSPSGTQTLWTDTESGTSQTLVGDQNGQNSKPTQVTSGYTAAGWYDSQYILLTQNKQLFIAPLAGSPKPILIGSIL